MSSSPIQILCIVIALSAAVPAHAQGLPEAVPTRADPPAEVAAFVKRLAGCNHWAAEQATDPESGERIARARFRLRCSTIRPDEARLRARFSKYPAAIEALDNAGSVDVGNGTPED